MFSLIIRRTWSNEICAPVLVSLNDKMTQNIKTQSVILICKQQKQKLHDLLASLCIFAYQEFL